MSVYVTNYITAKDRAQFPWDGVKAALTALDEQKVLSGPYRLIEIENSDAEYLLDNFVRYPLNLNDDLATKPLPGRYGSDVRVTDAASCADVLSAYEASRAPNRIIAVGGLNWENEAIEKEIESLGCYNGDIFFTSLAEAVEIMFEDARERLGKVEASSLITMIGNACPDQETLPGTTFYRILADTMNVELELVSGYS